MHTWFRNEIDKLQKILLCSQDIRKRSKNYHKLKRCVVTYNHASISTISIAFPSVISIENVKWPPFQNYLKQIIDFGKMQIWWHHITWFNQSFWLKHSHEKNHIWYSLEPRLRYRTDLMVSGFFDFKKTTSRLIILRSYSHMLMLLDFQSRSRESDRRPRKLLQHLAVRLLTSICSWYSSPKLF